MDQRLDSVVGGNRKGPNQFRYHRLDGEVKGEAGNKKDPSQFRSHRLDGEGKGKREEEEGLRTC